MVQAMLIGAVVLAAGAGVMKISQNQSKQNQSLLSKVQITALVSDLTEFLGDPKNCKQTLSQSEC